MTDIVLALEKATKLYAGVPAIEEVDFELRRGEIHALVGENGAGKSTLTKVMAGVVTLTSGVMKVDGAVVSPRTPLEARHLGIGMVFQENSLVPTMTVAQNLFLGQEKFYNRLRGIYIAAQQFLQSLNFDVAPTVTVGALGAAKKQMVEIARAFTVTVVSMINASAMAGAVGAGGLGDLAMQFGYQRFDNKVMAEVVAILIVIVTAVQGLGDVAARRFDRR